MYTQTRPPIKTDGYRNIYISNNGSPPSFSCYNPHLFLFRGFTYMCIIIYFSCDVNHWIKFSSPYLLIPIQFLSRPIEPRLIFLYVSLHACLIPQCSPNLITYFLQTFFLLSFSNSPRIFLSFWSIYPHS